MQRVFTISYIKQPVFWVILVFLNIFSVPVIVLGYALGIFLKIKFVCIMDDRIGHLAGSTELFLRRLQLGVINKKRTVFVGIASTSPPNKQLFRMFKRRLHIIQVPRHFWYFVRLFCCHEKSFLRMSGFFIFNHISNQNYYEFNTGKPCLGFTAKEEDKGKDLIKSMGLSSSDWFVCFHARDPTYLSAVSQHDNSYNSHRDCNIGNYLESAEFIASKGGFSLRMGAVVDKKLGSSNKIVDYATRFRSDFGDIYLCAKCRFFLGNTAGIFLVANIFNVPIAYANLIPLDCMPVRNSDIFIPKKIFSKKKKRFLTFKEIIESGIFSYTKDEQYNRDGLVAVENTSGEILDLTKEMLERLNGTWNTTKDDESLQKKFRSLFKKGNHCYGFPSRIGAKFLRENKSLLK